MANMLRNKRRISAQAAVKVIASFDRSLYIAELFSEIEHGWNASTAVCRIDKVKSASSRWLGG
jgi:hypothetical protein